ncbi:SatD family protein [Salinimicrobium flavum]|uniref:SatD family protein n=1 Tax=Salinimicrobium flavum TaxID=1737065 RepID=A0ABW5IZL0_9FLAO
MIAVITGDIINSRKEPAPTWLPVLKEVLNHYGKEPVDWEIFRGDSFQLTLPPEEAVFAGLHLKAAIKQIKDLDVRLGLGLGEQEHKAKKISESNGTAYVRSGECFEALKKQNLGIVSGDPEFDETLNLMFLLALLTANNWSQTVAEAIRSSLENPGKSQKEIAELLGKSQSSLSEALKRGGYEEIMKLEEYYRKRSAAL